MNVDSMAGIQHSWDRGKAATLKDVARAVGVSESTASVVLNNARSGTRVSADTRRALTEAAQRLGYRPNAVARSLQTGRSNRLGLYTGSGLLDARNMFFAELLGGMLEGSAEYGTNTLIHTSGTSAGHLLDLVSSRAIDGLVVHAAPNDPILSLLDELRVPAIAVADAVRGLTSVCVDDRAGGMLQAQHLTEMGHRHVIVRTADWPFASAVEREQSFLSKAGSLGLQVSCCAPAFLAGRPMLTPREIELITAKDNPATAIVAWNDAVAEGLCRELDAMGFSIPRQIAVMGFDGFQGCYLRKFELSTIRAPWSEVGRIAVSRLMSMLCGEPVPDVTVLPVRFVRGDTT